MFMTMKEDVGVTKCEHPSAKEAEVRVSFKQDERVSMPFTIMECDDCGAAYATTEQRAHNEKLYNKIWKAYRRLHGMR